MNDDTFQLPEQNPPKDSALAWKLIHLAIPVRVTHMVSGEESAPEAACTYDIFSRGARLISSRDVTVGDLITIERGGNKSLCQVVWVGDPNSSLRGLFTVERVTGQRSPWESELRQMQEQYLPLIPDQDKKKVSTLSTGHTRRRSPRYKVVGGVDLAQIGGEWSVEGTVEQLSEHGCLVSCDSLVTPGTGIRLVLNIHDVSLALRGHVKYKVEERSMGVEFQEIRQGDRPMLDYVFNRLREARRQR